MKDTIYATQVLQATERAIERAAINIHQDLQRGLNPLATVISIAPFVGILGTVRAIAFDTFVGVGIDKLTGLAVVAEGLSQACVPTAIGLLVGLQSLWCYKYLQGRLAEFDSEMADTSSSLVAQLARLFGHDPPARTTGDLSDTVPHLAAYEPDLPADHRFKRRSAVAAVSLLLVTCWVQVGRYFECDFFPLMLAIPAGIRTTLIMFCLSFLPVYVVWVKLLSRRSSTVPVIAAALCLSSCAAQLFFSAIKC